MMLLDDAALTRSSVVANANMNRERGLSGVNSYAKELGFAPLEWLRERRAVSAEPVRWLDLCCGSGRALLEAAAQTEGEPITLVGVDLMPLFAPGSERFPHLRWVVGALQDCVWDETFDLITCVHGLHYLGDKLGLLERYAALLRPGGKLVGQLDLANIDGIPRRALLAWLRQSGAHFDSRRYRVTLTGPLAPLPWRYLGADDITGANYTGQPGVRSVYEPV